MDKYGPLLDLGVDIQHGVIPLTGEINEALYTRLQFILTSMSNLGLCYDELTLVLNTPGGEVYHANAMIDLINLQKAQDIRVRIVCSGAVMSAGTLLLMHADIKEISPECYLLFHYGEDGQITSDNDANHSKTVRNRMKQMYLNNTKASKSTVNRWFNSNCYYNAEQALDIGLVDRITNYEKEKRTSKKSRARTRK